MLKQVVHIITFSISGGSTIEESGAKMEGLHHYSNVEVFFQ
jgi:hypothetical protein